MMYVNRDTAVFTAAGGVEQRKVSDVDLAGGCGFYLSERDAWLAGADAAMYELREARREVRRLTREYEHAKKKAKAAAVAR